MKRFIMVLMMCASGANAESLGLSLPSMPGNYQSDKFRSGEMDCSNSIGSATNLEFGVTGLIDGGGYGIGNSFTPRQEPDVGVYARIVIPLGRTVKTRINCNELYELELKRKRLELMKLEEELRQLRQLQFEE